MVELEKLAKLVISSFQSKEKHQCSEYTPWVEQKDKYGKYFTSTCIHCGKTYTDRT
jgi:hypothetical protein